MAKANIILPEIDLKDYLISNKLAFSSAFAINVMPEEIGTDLIFIGASAAANHRELSNCIALYPVQIAVYAYPLITARMRAEEIYSHFDTLKDTTFSSNGLELANYTAKTLQVSVPQFVGKTIPKSGSQHEKLYQVVINLYLEMLQKNI